MRFSIEEYPNNYDWMTESQKRILLSEYKYVRKMAVDGNLKYVDYLRELNTVLEILNIHIEYNWVGHRGEYFLATYDDAFVQEEWLFAASE